jgi:hypothetical protein
VLHKSSDVKKYVFLLDDHGENGIYSGPGVLIDNSFPEGKSAKSRYEFNQVQGSSVDVVTDFAWAEYKGPDCIILGTLS